MMSDVSVPLIEKLTAAPVDVATARLPADQGGAPARPGFYAWWLTDEFALPTVPTSPHPTIHDLGLAYIGIAPKDGKSAATIRSRILSNHLANAIGSSTLRRALTALLWDHDGEDWCPFITPAGKPALPPDECTTLTRWMERNLLVSWCVVSEPWDYEATLIHDMAPPLNSDHNHGYPFYPELRMAREYLMAVARAASA